MTRTEALAIARRVAKARNPVAALETDARNAVGLPADSDDPGIPLVALQVAAEALATIGKPEPGERARLWFEAEAAKQANRRSER